MHGLLLMHRTKAGRRDELEAVWREHMAPAIDRNADHLAYTYGLGSDPDTVVACQVYRSKEAADAFLRTSAYRDYIAASHKLLAGEPEVILFEPRWVKGV